MIYYSLGRKYMPEKENSRVKVLSKKNNHIEIEKIFNYRIFRVSKEKLLLINKYKLALTIYIIINN